jgi:PhzF family phenazine biosynthesis protein
MALPACRPFKQVDVFSDTPYLGNPVAVVLDGQGLDEASMQRLAAWTQLSETTFVLPATDPQADYRLRIFTPCGELPFAGHPTLGSCHAWLEAGGQPRQPERIVQQCALGLIELRHDPHQGRLRFAAPPLRRQSPSPSLLAKAASALGLNANQIEAAQLLDNGPHWLGLLLHDPESVLALQPDHQAIAKLQLKIGVCALHPQPHQGRLIQRASREAAAFGSARPQAEAALEVRAFTAPIGVLEDPVTGSLNASLGQWLMAEGCLPARYTAYQGQNLGRDGRIFVEADAQGQLWVGGHCVSCLDGQIKL